MAERARLVLASSSPRRLGLLRLAGLEPAVRPADVDEARAVGEDPAAYVARLARAKALAVDRAADEIVLAADTTVVCDDAVLGKPRDADEASAMLARLAGRTHAVTSGVAVLDRSGGLAERSVTTEVTFGPLSPERIAAYVATGEPLDKAGAYGIQGRGQVLVESVRGSWTNVVGLPVVETLALLRAAGLALP